MIHSCTARVQVPNSQVGKKGVQFCQHIYTPEIHPVTKQAYCEMEDEPHVLKVCVCVCVCVRERVCVTASSLDVAKSVCVCLSS